MRRRRTVPALLLAASVFLALGALTGTQATGATAGPRLLGRLAAAMFELDRWAPQHREEIQTVARERTRGSVDVGGLPMKVSVPPSAALANDTALANAIAADAGQSLYEAGRIVFIDGQGASGDISVTQPVRWAIGLLEREDHRPWLIALFVASGLATASLLLVLTTTVGGVGRALRLVAIGSAAYAVFSAGIWGLCEIAAKSFLMAPNTEVARLLADCARLGLQDAVIVGIGAVVLNLIRHQLSLQTERGREWLAAIDEPA